MDETACAIRSVVTRSAQRHDGAPMETLDGRSVRSRIDALRRRDVAKALFGAAGHKYELQPVLTDAELRAVERQWAIHFPDDGRLPHLPGRDRARGCGTSVRHPPAGSRRGRVALGR